MRARLLATAAAILTGGVLAASVALAVVADTRAGWAGLAFELVVVPLTAVIGVVIARRTTANPVGFLLVVVSLTVALTAAREIGWQVLASRPDSADSLAWVVAVLEQGAFWVLAAVALLLLHFPDGRLPSPRWRWGPATMVVATAATEVFGAFESMAFRPPLEDLARPFDGLPPWLEAVGLAVFVLMLVLVLASAFSLLSRYRHSGWLARRQIRWLAVGGLGVASYPMLCLAEILLWGEPTWFSGSVGLAGLVGIPVTLAIAMLRHDLYDVDRALAGTVTWGLVTTMLVAVYVLASATAGLVLGQDSELAAAGVTAVAAVALGPLRHRLQQRVDRRLYPLRRAAYDAVAQLQHDVSQGRTTPEELEHVLAKALRDPELRVGYRLPGAAGFVTADGVPAPPGGEPVLLAGTAVGVIVARSPQLTPELLRQVADRSTSSVETVRLRLELAGALRDVESSRSRLVQIGYEERRRLERDLHDGAQQRLVSLGMALRLAQRHLEDGTVELDDLLDQAVAELGTAVAELRQIAHGIRPSSLDDGLDAAVARLVRALPVPVELDVRVGVLPDDVATTAFFVISEALANAVKHADASVIALRVSRQNGSVIVSVSDDGRGGAHLGSASGIADRVAALGGSLQVESPAGRGTVVKAALPCAS